MPQLPSGLHFALDPSPLQEIMKNAHGGLKVHELMALESVNHLFSHINVLYFRESSGDPALALSEHSVVLPSNLEAYPSGFNLISIKSEFDKWSIEDQKAFKAFLNEKRTNDYLSGLLDSVVRKQNVLLEHPRTIQGMLATWWKLGIHPLQDEENDYVKPQMVDPLAQLLRRGAREMPSSTHIRTQDPVIAPALPTLYETLASLGKFIAVEHLLRDFYLKHYHMIEFACGFLKLFVSKYPTLEPAFRGSLPVSVKEGGLLIEAAMSQVGFTEEDLQWFDMQSTEALKALIPVVRDPDLPEWLAEARWGILGAFESTN